MARSARSPDQNGIGRSSNNASGGRKREQNQDRTINLSYAKVKGKIKIKIKITVHQPLIEHRPRRWQRRINTLKIDAPNPQQDPHNFPLTSTLLCSFSNSTSNMPSATSSSSSSISYTHLTLPARGLLTSNSIFICLTNART